jgi:hypothetical protein
LYYELSKKKSITDHLRKGHWKIPYKQQLPSTSLHQPLSLDFICFYSSRYGNRARLFCHFRGFLSVPVHVSLREGNFTFFIFYLRLFPVSFCYVLSDLTLGLLSLRYFALLLFFWRDSAGTVGSTALARRH